MKKVHQQNNKFDEGTSQKTFKEFVQILPIFDAEQCKFETDLTHCDEII
jgi:hypothetical protein